MLTLLKLLQSLLKTLHSDGTPAQVAAGLALGAALGLTPLMNVHNLVIVALILVLNVSIGGAMLGWALFLPLGFLLDPNHGATPRRRARRHPSRAWPGCWTTRIRRTLRRLRRTRTSR